MKRSFIRVPDFGGIDFEGLRLKIGADTYDFTRPQLSKAMEIVLDTIFGKYVDRENVKKKCYKSHEHSVMWEFKKHECYLAIYLQDATLSYTVRVNTVNSNPKETLRVVYFSYEHMAYYEDSLLTWLLRDFSRLIYEAVNLDFVFERGFDGLPRGTYRERSSGKVPFFYLHESILMTPIHYYDGVGYPHKGEECESCDFNEWFPHLSGE